MVTNFKIGKDKIWIPASVLITIILAVISVVGIVNGMDNRIDRHDDLIEQNNQILQNHINDPDMHQKYKDQIEQWYKREEWKDLENNIKEIKELLISQDKKIDILIATKEE